MFEPGRIDLPDVDATAALGSSLGRRLVIGDVLCLDGPLGAGKTTLVRGLVAAVGGDPAAVSSPTYTLLHRYDADIPVVHVDAYRLEGPGGLLGIGFDEAMDDAIGCIEWSDRVIEALAGYRVWRLRLEHAEGGRLAWLRAP